MFGCLKLYLQIQYNNIFRLDFRCNLHLDCLDKENS